MSHLKLRAQLLLDKLSPTDQQVEVTVDQLAILISGVGESNPKLLEMLGKPIYKQDQTFLAQAARKSEINLRSSSLMLHLVPGNDLIDDLKATYLNMQASTQPTTVPDDERKKLPQRLAVRAAKQVRENNPEQLGDLPTQILENLDLSQTEIQNILGSITPSTPNAHKKIVRLTQQLPDPTQPRSSSR